MNKKGLTLVELLVVISIIGILAGALTTVLNPVTQFKKSRDARRQSDLSQYRNALETYATVNDGAYTSRTWRQPAVAYPCDKLKPSFLSACPSDPSAFSYYYRSDGSGGGSASATKYVLWVQLEMGGYWEVCSDGRAGNLAISPEENEGDNLGTCQLP